MDMNLYGLEHQAAVRLDEARAASAHARLVASLTPPRHNVLEVVGLALIKLGRFVHRRSSARRREGRAPLHSWS